MRLRYCTQRGADKTGQQLNVKFCIFPQLVVVGDSSSCGLARPQLSRTWFSDRVLYPVVFIVGGQFACPRALVLKAVDLFSIDYFRHLGVFGEESDGPTDWTVCSMWWVLLEGWFLDVQLLRRLFPPVQANGAEEMDVFAEDRLTRYLQTVCNENTFH